MKHFGRRYRSMDNSGYRSKRSSFDRFADGGYDDDDVEPYDYPDRRPSRRDPRDLRDPRDPRDVREARDPRDAHDYPDDRMEVELHLQQQRNRELYDYLANLQDEIVSLRSERELSRRRYPAEPAPAPVVQQPIQPRMPQQVEDHFDADHPISSELAELKGDINLLKAEQRRKTDELKPVIVIEWSDEMSVGVDLIDKQHMILVRAINLLAKAVNNGGAKSLMAAIFETLADYTVTHFAYEEELFDLFGYPATEAHKHEHAALLNRVTTLKSKWEAGETEIGEEVLNFLVNWLKKHILGSDKKYGPFLVDHIAKASEKNQRAMGLDRVPSASVEDVPEEEDF